MDENNKNLSEQELEQAAGGAYRGRVIYHTVVRGDTLSGLAYRYRTTIQDIMALNPFIKNRDLIVDGWVLTIPDNT